MSVVILLTLPYYHLSVFLVVGVGRPIAGCGFPKQRSCMMTASVVQQPYQASTLQRPSSGVGATSGPEVTRPEGSDSYSQQVAPSNDSSDNTSMNSTTLHHQGALQTHQEFYSQICLNYSELQTLPHPPRSLLATGTTQQQLKVSPLA